MKSLEAHEMEEVKITNYGKLLLEDLRWKL